MKKSHSRAPLRFLCTILSGALILATDAIAGGKKVEEKIKDTEDKYEYKYKDSSCHYNYKFDYRSGKTDLKQKGDCSHIAPPFKPVSVFQMPRTVPPVARGTITRCDREQLGRILGGVAGGVIGSRMGRVRTGY
jgi:hypothetical protein